MELANPEAWRALQLCVYCGGDCTNQGDDIMLLCDCCLAKGACLRCLRDATGEALPLHEVESPSFQWMCSQGCKRVSHGLVEATGQKRSVGSSGEYTSELVRYSKKYRSSQQVVATAVSMFHKAFGPARYADGSDLVELVCQGETGLPVGDGEEKSDGEEEEEDQAPDCSNFRVLVLRKGGAMVSAAALRVHGDLVAEVPYITTRQDYRREGHCRRLMFALEELLHSLQVRWLVLPAADATAAMWKAKFEFTQAPDDLAEVLEDRIVTPGGTSLLLKRVAAPAPLAIAATAPRTTKAGGKAGNSARPRKSVRFALDVGTGSDSSGEDSGSDDAEEYTAEEEEEEEEEEDGEEEGVKEAEALGGCAICGIAECEDWQEDEETGALVCKSCSHHMRQASTPRTARTPQAAAAAGANVCLNCRTSDAAKFVKHAESGGWECSACNRYRLNHKGQPCPPSIYQRRKGKTQALRASSSEAAGSQDAMRGGGAMHTPAARAAPRSRLVSTPTPTPTSTPVGGISMQRPRLRRATLGNIAERRRIYRSAVAAMMAEEMHRFRCEEAVGGGLAEVVGALAAAGASPECGAVQDMQCRMEEAVAQAKEAQAALAAAEQAAPVANEAGLIAAKREVTAARQETSAARCAQMAAEAQKATAQAALCELRARLQQQDDGHKQREQAQQDTHRQEGQVAAHALAQANANVATLQNHIVVLQAAVRASMMHMQQQQQQQPAAAAAAAAAPLIQEVAGLKEALACKEAELATCTQDLAAAAAARAAADAALASTQDELQATSVALTAAHDLASAAQQERDADVAAAHAVTEQARQEAAAAQQQLDAKAGELAAVGVTVAALEAGRQAKDAALAKLQLELEAACMELDEAAASLAQGAVSHTATQSKLAETEQALAAAEAALAAKNAALEQAGEALKTGAAALQVKDVQLKAREEALATAVTASKALQNQVLVLQAYVRQNQQQQEEAAAREGGNPADETTAAALAAAEQARDSAMVKVAKAEAEVAALCLQLQAKPQPEAVLPQPLNGQQENTPLKSNTAPPVASSAIKPALAPSAVHSRCAARVPGQGASHPAQSASASAPPATAGRRQPSAMTRRPSGSVKRLRSPAPAARTGDAASPAVSCEPGFSDSKRHKRGAEGGLGLGLFAMFRAATGGECSVIVDNYTPAGSEGGRGEEEGEENQGGKERGEDSALRRRVATAGRTARRGRTSEDSLLQGTAGRGRDVMEEVNRSMGSAVWPAGGSAAAPAVPCGAGAVPEQAAPYSPGGGSVADAVAAAMAFAQCLGGSP